MGEHAEDETADFYSESHKQVLFPGGTTTAKFDVTVIDDKSIITVENPERLKISIDPLSLPYGVVLGDITSAELYILDNDGKQYMCISVLWILFLFCIGNYCFIGKFLNAMLHLMINISKLISIVITLIKPSNINLNN